MKTQENLHQCGERITPFGDLGTEKRTGVLRSASKGPKSIRVEVTFYEEDSDPILPHMRFVSAEGCPGGGCDQERAWH
jgi:hypothetical protein